MAHPYPSFTQLTAEICSAALEMVMPTIKAGFESKQFKRPQGHLIVLNPTDGSVLFEYSWDEAGWEHNYREVALGKATASWTTGRPSIEVQVLAPYLMEPGFSKYGGSAVSDPGYVVVSFSGVDWWFDQFISEIVLAAIKALCLHEMFRPGGIMESGHAIMGSAK